MIACDQKALRGQLVFLLVFLFITLTNVISVNAQITPVTQYECDPRSTTNGGVCPTGCNFTPAVEKGCNCFDSIDNDGDGKIDAADIGDCGVYFGLTFAGSGSSNCSLVPPAGNIFAGIGAPAGSQQNTADTQSKVAAGDVTGDGVPEAVITSKWNNEVRVINADGTVNASFNLSGKKSIFTGFTDVDGKTADPDRLLLEHEVLIADIKRAANLNPDGKGEIFAIVSSRGGNPKTPPNGFYLLALTWTKPDPNGLQLLYDPIPLGTNRPGIFGIADMDGDGFAELYLRDRIYAAETGKLLASEGAKTHLNTTLWDSDVTSAPAAVTVTGDNKMELICGTKVYSIPTLTNRNPAGPSALTLVKDMNVDFPATKCFVKLMNDPTEYGIDTHSSTSVADVDADGFIDVVITGALNSTVGRTAVFYWNIQKNTVAHKFTPNSTELGLALADPNYASYATGWIWGTGRVNIGDANGDGKSDLTFIAGNQLFCLTTDGAGTGLVSLWTQNSVATATGNIGYRAINDSRSGVLTATIYDFNNDGQPEMVYRDSQSLNVIDGATGQNLLWSTICQSHTYTEGPIIADVNGDGATDICVTCNTSNSFNINADIQQQALGQVRLYFSNGNTWLPTRKVWNQPGYFVVNINDDLTLPFPQLNQNLIFSNAPCPNGVPGPQRPLNVFLNQVPYMNANGCPVFPAPDLAFIGQDPATADPNSPSYFPAVIVTPPICGNLDIGVVFNIGNTGDLPITDNVPVSFFNGDPTLPGATRLHNTTINITNLSIGDTLTTAPIIFNGPGTVFDLYILLYNDGSVLPVTLTGQTATECQIANNLYKVTVTPSPFTAQINKFKDNLKCVALDPNSGELRARIFKGATEVFDFSPYTFQWYSGVGTTNPIQVAQGGQNAVITGLVEGDYTLVVTNTQKGCSSAPVSANIALTITIPTVTVSVLSNQTQCNPPNGKLEALVTGGNTGYTFEWFSNAVPLGITAPVADGLKGDNYTVVVSRNGCITSANAQVQDLAVEPDASASVLQNVVDCTLANGGSITGQALLAGVAQNPAEYTFNWYFYNNVAGTRGSILPIANGTGPTRTGLAVGFYQLEVIRISTQCVANQSPIVEITNSIVLPTAVITETSPQTSCDATQPNGMLTASVLINGVAQNTADFTFEWFKGDNTLPANLHSTTSGVNGSVAEKVAGGGVFYTVKVTSALNCSDTEKLIISEDINVPVVTLTPSDNSICDPALAGASFNGGISAAVTFDGVAVADFTNYKFTWHDGSLISDPTIVVANDKLPSLSQLDGGNYTVVAERLDLFCKSNPVTTVINNTPVLPVITPGTVPSTNCAGGTPNGQVTVTSVTPVGPYTFKWYSGNTTNPGSELTPLNNATITGLQGGLNYTVEVTINSSGCKSTVTTPLADNKQLPVLTLTPAPNSICDVALGFNGSIAQNTLTDANALGGDTYTFAWSNGNDMTSIIAGQTTSTLSGRNGGFYTSTITNNRLNCTSAPVTVEIINSQVFPAITTTTVPSTNCVGGAPNGSTAANVGGVTAGFTFNWFVGNLITDPAVPAGNGGNTFATNALAGGINYTVKVRNNASGCTSTLTSLLPDNKQLPVLTLTPSPNSICDVALGFNGSIAQNTLTDANALGGDTYTFAWSNGNDMTSIIAGQTTSTLSGRNGGFYTSTITNNRLNCTSAPVTVEIINTQVFPVITTTTVPSTNCVGGAANGSTAANVGGVTAGYTFNWFAGNLITDPAVPIANGGNTFATNALAGGINYTVLVRDNSSGCESTLTTLLPDNKQLPVLTLTPAPNSICDVALGFNGSIAQNTLTDANALGGDTYTFAWSNGNDMTSIIAGQTTSTLSGRNGGFYTSTITNNRLNCTSAPVTVEIINTQIFPVITTTTVPSTNCVGGAANGSTAANVGGVTAGYTFNWFAGNLITDPAVPIANGGNTFATSALAGGINYTVLVRDNSSGCESTLTTLLPDNKELPVLTLTPAPNSICDVTLGFNGSISQNTLTDANALGGDTYTFAWSNGNDMTSIIAGQTTSTLSGRNGGFYTSTITNNRLNCTSAPVTVEIINTQIFPVITTTTVPSTNCVGGAANGSTAANVGGVTAGYTFNWFVGNLITDPAVPIANGGNTFATNALAGGINYTVLVRDNTSGCESTLTTLLPDNKQLPVLTLTPTPNSICDVALGFNGSIAQNTLTDANALGGDTYTFAWSNGNDMTSIIAGQTTSTLSGRDGGFYTSTITNNRLNCTSAPVTVEIINNLALPIIVADAQGSTNCDPLLKNGVASITTVDGVAPGAAYTYSWYIGNSVAGASISNNPSATGVQGGSAAISTNNYTVEVRNISTGCINESTVNVPDNSQLPALTLTPQPNTICDPAKAAPGVTFDGQVQALVNNIPGGGNVNDYFFDWSIPSADGNGANLISALDVGLYSVTALHNPTGCLSPSYSAQVLSQKVLPTIDIQSIASQNCPGGAPDGSAFVNGVLPAGKTYSYKWFDGNLASGVVKDSDATYQNVQGGISGVSLLAYTVEVTILESGCINTATVGVSDDSKLPQLGALVPTNNTFCIGADGSAALSSLSYRSVVQTAPYTGFTFNWSNGDTTPNTTTPLIADTYTLTVTNTNDNCISNPVQVTISDDLYLPLIDIAVIDQTSCDTTTPNGSLTATIDQSSIGLGTGVVAGYNFTWVDNVTAASTPSNQILNLKGDQTYTITAERQSTGCISSKTQYLNETITTPVVTVIANDLTKCVPPDGSLSATVLPAGTYNYFWYDGNDAVNENAVITGADFTGGSVYSALKPGEYTVVAQNTATKCISQQVIKAVADASPQILPVIANTAIPTSCNLNDGAMEGSVQTFNSSFTALAATDILTTAVPHGLAVGAKVILSRNGANPLPVPLEASKIYFVQSVPTATTLTLEATLGGGVINLSVDGDGFIGDYGLTAGYSFNWYESAPTGTNPVLPIDYFTNPPNFAALVPNPINPNSTYNSLPTGLYSLEVTDNTTGCRAYVNHTLPFIGSHAVIRISKTNTTVCPPLADNGSVTIRIEDPPALPPGATYDIILKQGVTPVTGTFTSAQLIDVQVSNTLSTGTYIVEVKQNFGTFCVLKQDVTIGADARDPIITLSGSIFSNTACDVTQFDGRIDLNVAKDPDDLTAVTDYDVTMAPAVATSGFPLNNQIAGNYSAVDLGPGSYTFTAIDNGTGCSSSKTFTVLNNPVIAELANNDVLISAAEFCDELLETSAKAIVSNVKLPGGVNETIADYEFEWKNTLTNAVVLTLLGDGAANNGAGGEEFLNNLPPGSGTVPAGTVKKGSYSVTVTKKTDVSGTGGIGCKSTPYAVVIPENKIKPQITLTPSADTSCDPNFFEGSIAIDVTTASGPGSASTYSYTWNLAGGPGQPTNEVLQSGSVGSSRVDLQACKLEYSIVSPK